MMAIAPVVMTVRENNENVKGVGTAFCISALPSGKPVFVTAEHVAVDLLCRAARSSSVVA
jgi:hypothetical protein